MADPGSIPEWETLESEGHRRTDRMWVPGGWLVRVTYFPDVQSAAITMKFIKDYQHYWATEAKPETR